MNAFFKWMLFLCLPVIWQCGSDNVAGTSTTTGNTITGVARDENGQPVEGAQAILRTHDHAPDGVLAAPPLMKRASALALDTATTDSAGRYLFEVEEPDTFFLEITHNGQVAWVKNLVAEGDTAYLGSAVLKNTVTLSGNIVMEEPTGQTHWVGIAGTDHYVKVDALGEFVLPNLATGSHSLQIVRITNSTEREVFTVVEVQVENAGDYVLEPIVLPETGSGTLDDKPVTCSMNYDTLRQSNAVDLTSPPRMVMRSVLLLETPAVVNIDLCRGEWSLAGNLPGTQPPLEYFAGEGVDYILNGETLLYSRDTSADNWQEHALLTLPTDQIDFWEGNFYAFNSVEGSIGVYPSLETFLLGDPASHLTLSSGASFYQFSVSDLYVYYLLEGAPPTLVPTLNGTPQGEFPLTALAEVEVTGMKAVGNQVYILSSTGTLFVFDGLSGTEKKQYTLQSENLWFGLSKF